jgi:hypothetical protein
MSSAAAIATIATGTGVAVPDASQTTKFAMKRVQIVPAAASSHGPRLRSVASHPSA